MAGKRAWRARDAGATDRFMVREDDYLTRVEAQFAGFAAADPGRVRTVDAGGDEAAVTARLLMALSDLL